MIRNSTKKFKEKYAYSSAKKLQVMNNDREESEASSQSIRFDTTLSLNHTRSTPKIQNSKKLLLRTQPIIAMSKSKVMDEKYSVFTRHTEIESIQSIMKKRGIDQDQLDYLRSGKLKRVKRNSQKTRDPQDFIEKLPKNSLFFCCDCFQYIFDIEKHRHFPDCKDRINKSEGNAFQIGRSKLQKLVQLAYYTSTSADQIKELHRQYLSKKYDNIALMNYPRYSFFTLKEIKYAFAYIFNELLKNAKQENDSTIFSCF